MSVQTDTDALRFELKPDGCCVGFVEYYLFDDVAIVTHTEVTPGREGQGLGADLVRHALNYFKADAKVVVPVCGFFAGQIRRNPAYVHLLAPGCKRVFNL